MSLEQYRADYAFWLHAAEGWRKDAKYWFERWRYMRRGSFFVMLALAVETVVLTAIAWRWYAG